MKKKEFMPLKKEGKQVSLKRLDRKNIGYLILILVVTFVVFSPSLKNEFITAWDDGAYITDNPHIQLSPANIKSSFLHGEQQYGKQHGMMYVPLTSLSFSINYYFSGLNPKSYHLVNILLHLIIIVFVFGFVYLLFFSFEVAIITASLFALHTMQVESVAFAAGRRDLLYSLFFILSLIFYLKYIDTGKWKYYIFSLSIFIFSLLSKGQGVSLPFTLLLLDFFRGRKFFVKKTILEKIPFFIFAAVCGIIILLGKGETPSYYSDGVIPLYIKIILPCYGYLIYLLKLLVPFNLSAIYPYPINPDISLSSEFFIYPLIIVFLILLFYYLVKRSYKNLMFGILFFTINILLVLQIIPNSYGIINEHYVYLPSIGIFFIFGFVYKLITERYKHLKSFFLSLLIAYLLFLSAFTYSRCKVWKDNITLYSDVISKFPNEKLSYNNRGSAYYKLKHFDEAFKDFDMAIKLGGKDAEAFNNRGSIYFERKEYENAIDDYVQAIKLKPDYGDAYYNKGNALQAIQKTEDAIKDYDVAISYSPDNAYAFYNRGVAYGNINKYEECIKDYKMAIKLKPDYVEAYYNEANTFVTMKKYDQAISDYNKCIDLNPNFSDAYINLGNLYVDLKRFEDAIKVYDICIKAIPDFAKAYYNRGNAYYNLKQYEKAIENFNISIQIKPDYALAYFNRGNNYLEQKKYSEALKDWEKALQLNPDYESMLRGLINDAKRYVSGTGNTR